MRTPTLRDWERLPDDPDPVSDLGYDLLDLDLLRSTDGERTHVLVLPKDDDRLRENAYIVADVDAVCDLETKV